MRSVLLSLLRCPIDRSPLAEASEALLETVNTAIREHRAYNLGGKLVEQAIDGGLIRRAGDLLYPVVDGIPLLIRDEAISLASIHDTRPDD